LRYVSTRGGGQSATLGEAIASGVASDGGLYMPESIPLLPMSVRPSVASLAETATAVLAPFVEEELSGEALRSLAAAALDFPIPLRPLDTATAVLELFHGPTLAFKDVGARCLARLLTHFLKGDRPLTVLVATSGDTGGAVASAFFGLAGVRVVILYPRGQVSRLQEAQFASLGGNVTALAVEGTFDDCQRLAKEAFADEELRRGAALTSANSISIGRLLPQIVYYVHALAQHHDDGRPIVISVPSGNFGNLTAGLMAKRMGLPIARFVAATNANDVVPAYLRTGRYAPRASVRTISNAMDVGAPSNLERVQALYGGNLAALRADVVGTTHGDAQTRDCIRETFARTGYLLDPHTAVGLLGLREAMAEGSAPEGAFGIVLATAHPAKFREELEPLLGEPIPLPPALLRLEGSASSGIRVNATLDEIRPHLIS